MNKTAAIGTLAIAVAMGVYWYLDRDPTAAEEAEKRGIKVVDISAEAQVGAPLFDENSAACQEAHGSGTDNGPPLIHQIYEPSNRGNASFLMAVRNGVRPHHWRFSPMPKSSYTSVRSSGPTERKLKNGNSNVEISALRDHDRNIHGRHARADVPEHV